MILDTTALEAELNSAITQALELERTRHAELTERRRRCEEDLQAFAGMVDESAERISTLQADLGRLQSLRNAPRAHIESADCWCVPTLNHKNVNTGVEHWIHHEPT